MRALLPWVCFGVVMNEVVDRILNSYELMRPLSAERVADSRQKVSRYLESLAFAGQRDVKQLVEYGGLFERIARGARSSVYRLLNAKPGIFSPRAVAPPSKPWAQGVECPFRVKTEKAHYEQMSSGLPPKDGVIGRPSLWIAEDFGCCASG